MGGKSKKSAENCGTATTAQSSKPVPPVSQGVLPCAQKHWFGIRVVDEAGKAVHDVTAEIVLPDGSTTVVDFSTETLETDGTWRTAKVLDAGDCAVTFPELHDMEWWPQGGSAADFTVNASATADDGECALSVADRLGFREYLSVWSRSKNKSLRDQRPNPNQLVAGDVLAAPDQKEKSVKKATDKVWTFVVKTKKPAKLRLLLLDKDNKPLSGKAWELLSPAAASGTTGGDGMIEFNEIPLQDSAASLKVTMADPPPPLDPLPPQEPVVPTPYPITIVVDDFTDKNPALGTASRIVEWELTVGGLPSFEGERGVQARLHNLGFGCDVDDDNKRTARAVRAYQRLFLNNKSGSGVATDIATDIRDRHDKAK